VDGGQPSCPPYAGADPRVGWAAPLPTVRFVPQTIVPEGTPYERYIFESRQVPVREGLHDFFNGLVWRAFPRTKSALNRLQAEAIERDGISARRGPVRDAITVFDENGAILDAPGALWDALLAREWRRLFVDLRPLWAQARLVVFGHALLEQLARPRKGLTAHVWAERPSGNPVELDAWLSGRTTAMTLQAKPFTPLPVLGVPGWWPGNADFSFYDDPLVFRPRRA
jgi:hypothetical protein